MRNFGGARGGVVYGRTDTEATCCIPHCERKAHATQHMPLCERHLAKAWAEFEVLHGAEVENAKDERADFGDPNLPGVVYFVRVMDMLKIGWTSNLRGRISTLQADALLHFQQGTRKDEAAYHKQFREHLVAGREWFSYNEQTENMVMEIRGPSRYASGPIYC
ncbi:GIY-YIG nuclease family protein [Neomicrococcus aestuarii]|uniref:GIY-YIG nuclease family protein n=1 Tax=Neomicrococcus aestuarii TaxID=556325 RepID=UPI0016144343|nr:GIY-YIG nuclease family protein [Neomicrococcus aestuarii]